MKKLLNLIKPVISELVIVLLFALAANNFVGDTITGDGAGYYEYLPSVFIHNDLVRINMTDQEKDEFIKRVDHFGFYSEQGEHWVNRYPCGTAVLESPFFLITWMVTDMQGIDSDGYQKPFHRSIYFAAIFYLFLSLLFLKKVLVLYRVNRLSIVLSQVLLVFSTSVTQYATSNAAFSHIYSLFAITAFIFFAKKYFQYKRVNFYLYACLFLGLIVILRQVNGLSILFVPFLAGSWGNFKVGVTCILRKPIAFTKGIVIAGAVVFIQMLAWYLQTGHFIVYSYQGYGFNFLSPQIVNILFSYRKGLFIYTPVLLLGLAGVFRWLYKREYYAFFSWMFFFCILTYVLSSWCFWYYGGSYGLRAYIDFYAIFFIPFALMFNHLASWSRLMVILLAFFIIPLNLIQTYQYKTYILHGANMDKEKYWKIFLKTDERYRGILWKKDYDYNKYEQIKEINLNDINVSPNSDSIFFKMKVSDFAAFKNVKLIHLSFENDFRENDYSRLAISIDDKNGNNKLFHRPYLIHFAEDDFNKRQRGFYNYELPFIQDVENQILTFVICTGNEGIEMKDVKISFLSRIE